jgi:hypothetical protein
VHLLPDSDSVSPHTNRKAETRRAPGFGEVRSEHYVFPACEASHFASTPPQTSWRTAWRNLTRLINSVPDVRAVTGPSETSGDPQSKGDLKKVKWLVPMNAVPFKITPRDTEILWWALFA